ncbi:hypothetical protein KIPB_004085 [Kipferlia bialata]|uniref:Calcineurin-like phosphoesterase domain-containing protein n=1 Tax=Kipferlia bialata TaxID=797122 RepID=A0A9K3CUH2_9EUKA|nr:hypothetical protein KIPB_004085 [Kipferlia bialata]|eukprot:g4085.t1
MQETLQDEDQGGERKAPTGGAVISDIHMFAQRSSLPEHTRAIHRHAARSAFFVLNGDIFDFKWAQASLEITMESAVAWLTELCEAHAHCQFHYVLGNHDGVEGFAAKLATLEGAVPNFHWHSTHVVIGTALFVHGDLPLSRKRGSHSFKRQLKPDSDIKVKGRLASLGYQALVSVRVLPAVRVIWPNRRVSKRMGTRLSLHSEAHPAACDFGAITDVYFGHTHVAFSGIEHQSVRYHNTGAMIQTVKAAIFRVEGE